MARSARKSGSRETDLLTDALLRRKVSLSAEETEALAEGLAVESVTEANADRAVAFVSGFLYAHDFRLDRRDLAEMLGELVAANRPQPLW